jgi:hypothetical protein
MSPTEPETVEAVATLAATFKDVSQMVLAHYPHDPMRYTLTMVKILEYGMEKVREQWAKERQAAHGREM